MTGIQLHSEDGKTYDLLLDGRGMTVGETTAQNQTMILAAHKGEFKEHPTLGVGIADIVNDHDFRQWKRIIVEQLEADGQKVEKIEINENSLTLEAQYK